MHPVPTAYEVCASAAIPYLFRYIGIWDRLICSISGASSARHVQTIIIVSCSELDSIQNTNEFSETHSSDVVAMVMH